MSLTGICSICGIKTDVYRCSNEECKKLVCLDCSNDYILPLIDFYKNLPVFPLLKCPSCGMDLIRTI
ncbi:MAG: hypothetical protein ACFFBP_20510 [Promethearchaeota archaeon]